MAAYGLMFHHFHDARHAPGQGSISAEDFAGMIDYVGRDRILSADEWRRRALAGSLKDNDLCLTFDDALLCQYEVAYPVMRDLGLTAFWFVYSSVFEGNTEPLEIYRHFRHTQFPSMDDFYRCFLETASATFPDLCGPALEGFDPASYLVGFPFYTRNDRIFRYLRDGVLKPERYHAVMAAMMTAAGFEPASIAGQLWMTDQHLRALHDEGHVIGLHSYHHPTRVAALPPDGQREEYRRNRDHLTRVLGQAPTTMSHPCNSYGPETLGILRDLGIGIGFRANMQDVEHRSVYEFLRQDHANIMKDMRA